MEQSHSHAPMGNCLLQGLQALQQTGRDSDSRVLVSTSHVAQGQHPPEKGSRMHLQDGLQSILCADMVVLLLLLLLVMFVPAHLSVVAYDAGAGGGISFPLSSSMVSSMWALWMSLLWVSLPLVWGPQLSWRGYCWRWGWLLVKVGVQTSCLALVLL